MEKRLKKTPVDTGYSWVVLFASTSTSALIVGNMKSFGILYNEFLRYYGNGAGNTAGIGSLLIFLSFALGPFANHLCELYSFRRVVFCGGILYAIGMFTSAFVPKMEFLFGTIGVIGGTGSGLILTPSFTILSFYFERRRGLANGTFLAGSAVAVILLSYLYKFLIDYYGIHGTLMIIGGMLANVCVFSSLYRQPSILCNRESKKDGDSKPVDEELTINYANHEENCDVGNVFIYKENTKDVKKIKSRRRLFDLSLFRDKKYCLVVLSSTIYSLGHFGNFTIVPAQVAHLGYGKDNVSLIISIMGAMEIIAKLLFGWFTDLGYLKAKHIFVVIMTVGGVTALGFSFLHSFPGYVVYAVIFAMFPLNHYVILPIMILDSVGIEKLPRAFGTASLFMSFGYLLSQPIPGWIKDATGTWDNSFRYVGAIDLLAALVIVLQPFIVKHSGNNEQPDTDETL